MAFQDVPDHASQFAQRYEHSEDCNVGDVATIIVGHTGPEYSGVCVGVECGIEVDYESVVRLCEVHKIVFPLRNEAARGEPLERKPNDSAQRRGNMDTERESVVKEVTYVPPNEGKKLWVTDELITFKVTGEDTGGNYSLTDSMVPPQGGPPPHIHHREDEAFWVLEGELEILVGEDKFKASAGSFVHLPKGVLHSYQNISTGPARFLTLIVPAGLEKFFEEVGKPATDLSSPPAFEQEDVDKLLAVAPRYGVQIPPPPES